MNINTYLILFYFYNTFLCGLIVSLIDSRNYWRKRWESSLSDD